MNIIIKNPIEEENIPFKEIAQGGCLSEWINFVFKVKKDIDKTGLLFFLETSIEDLRFQNKNGSNTKTFRFGKRTPLKANDTFERRVRFYSPNIIQNGMPFTLRLYSVIDEVLREHKVIVISKK